MRGNISASEVITQELDNWNETRKRRRNWTGSYSRAHCCCCFQFIPDFLCSFYSFGNFFWETAELKSALFQSLGSQFQSICTVHMERICASQSGPEDKFLERCSRSSGKDTESAGELPVSPWFLDGRNLEMEGIWRWKGLEDPKNPVKRRIFYSINTYNYSIPTGYIPHVSALRQKLFPWINPKKMPQLSWCSFSCWFIFFTNTRPGVIFQGAVAWQIN